MNKLIMSMLFPVLLITFLASCDGIIYSTLFSSVYTVGYDGNGSNGGNVPAAPAACNPGDLVRVSGNTGNLVKTGCFFAGWNTEKGGGGSDYSEGEYFTVGSSNITLFAKWRNSPYTITFDANGGTGTMADQRVIYGFPEHLNPNVFTRIGCGFGGWSLTATGSPVFADGSLYMTGTANVILYATWIAAPQNINVTDNTSYLIISWDPVAGASGYYLERAKESTPGVFLQIDDITSTVYNHSGAFPRAVNYYRVRAYNAIGHTGPCSSTGSQIKTGTRILYEDWEDGTIAPWINNTTTGDTVEISSAYANTGTNSFRTHDNGDWARCDGIYYEFAGGTKAGYYGLYLRKVPDDGNSPFINIGGDTTSTDYGSISFEWDGVTVPTYPMTVAGGINGLDSAANNVFHHIEFKNVNFDDQTFDFYVDGTAVDTNVPFYNYSAAFTQFHLSVGWYGVPSYAYFDDIEVWE